MIHKLDWTPVVDIKHRYAYITLSQAVTIKSDTFIYILDIAATIVLITVRQNNSNNDLTFNT